MKKIVYILLMGLSVCSVYSQEIQDAVRFSQDNISGTARFRAMSGAFGALGGDLSSVSINPASSAVFTYNQIGFSFGNYGSKNESSYFGTNTSACDGSFEMNQFGAVFVFKSNNSSSKVNKFSLGITYENTNNFDNFIYSAGTNPTTSVAQYFLSYANGIPLNVITGLPYSSMNYAEQQAFMGYEGYVINPVSDNSNNTLYNSNVPNGDYYQQNYIYSNGYNGKIVFNAAAQVNEKFHFGLNLNSHFIDYYQTTSFYESNNNDTQNGLQRVQFDNSLLTYGNGFSFQLGTIVKVMEGLRFGFTYDSPIWYNLTDETTQYLASTDTQDGQTFSNVVNPGIINIFPQYGINTPWKISTSLAYVFAKSGLISVDYAFKDYNSLSFSPSGDPYFSNLNAQMSSVLKSTSEIRVGAEYRIQNFSLRGGYRFEESPYKNRTTLGDLNSFSTGVGYDFGPMKVDFAYANTQRTSNQGFFSQGLTSPATVKNQVDSFFVTFLFGL
jgi:long-subunit fatty acid transport protein